MLKSSSNREISIVEAIFLVSVLLGPAAAYSKLYLFHLVLLVLLLTTAFAIRAYGKIQIPLSLRWDVAFFLFFLGWYGLSILWAQDKLLALQYCVYIGLGVLTVYYTATICRTLERMRAALWTILAAISLELALALMEGMRLIRLPFSPYSPHRWLFGREPSDFARLSQSQIDHVMSVPTGFMANPNNLTAMLVLVLPLFLFASRWWVAVLGSAATYIVTDMTGARAGIIGFWVVMALAVVLFVGHRLRTSAITVLVIAMTMGTALLTGATPLANLSASSGAVLRFSDGLVSAAAIGGDSVGIRTQLILNGMDALRETYGLGVGAGGSLTVQRNAASDKIGEIGSMHNFWVELLVDGGVLFAALFLAWSGWLVWRLWQIGRSSEHTILRYLGQALSLGFVGFFFSAIGPSSVIYMLPMWMVIGLALAVVWLNAEARSMPASPEPDTPALAVAQ
jgi:teichuronic acid biosynthesis protein TuaE